MRESYDERIPTNKHALLNLNGWPYLSAEYLDQAQFQTVDRKLVRNQVLVDTTNPYHSIVDIVIDNVGERPSGNKSSYKQFLDLLVQHSAQLGGYLDVVKPFLTVKIEYSIESELTGRLLRVNTAKMVISNKTNYIDINGIDMDDNAILTNFSDSSTITVANRANGSDRMVIRIRKINLFYTGLKHPISNPFDNRRRPANDEREVFRPNSPKGRYDPFYHSVHQPQYGIMPDGPADTMSIPPSWWSFNKYYHFENKGKSMALHFKEINDRNNTTFSIPIGSITLDRTFVVNTSYRIMFKISVWKNDTIVLNNTSKISKLLGVPYAYSELPPRRDHDVDGKLNTILSMLSSIQQDNARRDWQIRRLRTSLNGLMDPDNPNLDDDPTDPNPDDGGSYPPIIPDPDDGDDFDIGDMGDDIGDDDIDDLFDGPSDPDDPDDGDDPPDPDDP